jgi:hypothetical protein
MQNYVLSQVPSSPFLFVRCELISYGVPMTANTVVGSILSNLLLVARAARALPSSRLRRSSVFHCWSHSRCVLSSADLNDDANALCYVCSFGWMMGERNLQESDQQNDVLRKAEHELAYL